MEVIDGKITGYNERGEMHIIARYDNTAAFARCGFKECRVALKDSRRITNEQRRKAYALLDEIADWSGDVPEYLKERIKWKFVLEQHKELAAQIFSLSDCDVTTAREFISYLIDFVLYYDIPTRVPLSELCDDIRKYVYSCLKHKKCAVCGRKAELHHVDAVGMGNNRQEIVHEGMRVLPLCREHHSEAHGRTKPDFLAKYRLETVRLDKELCKKWKLKASKEVKG